VRYTQETEATGLQSGISSPASSNASVEAAQFIIDIDVQDAWNRMRRMKARVDCGSDRHLMSRETAESLGLPITPYKKGPFKPIGSGIVAVNSSINARWEAEGVPFYDKFLIPPGPDALDEYDIMIGVKRMNHLYDITFNPKNPKHLKGFLKQFKSKSKLINALNHVKGFPVTLNRRGIGRQTKRIKVQYQY
jgi:hypothetical protein